MSIVAVFLALAIGIVLGSTELQGPAYNILNSTTGKLQNELGQVSTQRDAAQQQAALGQNYAQAVEPVVLHDLLACERLLIITEPGAPKTPSQTLSPALTRSAVRPNFSACLVHAPQSLSTRTVCRGWLVAVHL